MLTRLFYSVMVLSMAVFFWGCTPVSDSGESGNKGDLLVVFLVRHAEKVDQSMDPDLSEDGYLRAEALALALADANIEQVHSSGLYTR